MKRFSGAWVTDFVVVYELILMYNSIRNFCLDTDFLFSKKSGFLPFLLIYLYFYQIHAK